MSTPTPAPTTKPVAAPKLGVGRIKGAEYARNVHRVTPEATNQLKDVLNPAYWAHVAAKLALYDEIEVIPEGGAWYAKLLVVGCSKLHAKVAVLLVKQLQEKASDKPVGDEGSGGEKPAFSVAFKGPQRKWSVIRTSDNAYVKEGFDNKEDAAKWLEDNEADLLA
jgi:hypothetical protein